MTHLGHPQPAEHPVPACSDGSTPGAEPDLELFPSAKPSAGGAVGGSSSTGVLFPIHLE